MANGTQKIHLDNTIKSAAVRTQLVRKLIAETPPEKLTPYYLDTLATYITNAAGAESKDKAIVTDNRQFTIKKRQTSFEGLALKFECGEDGIYSLIANDKNIIFAPKISITEEDVRTIPGMRELRESIETTEARLKDLPSGRDRFLLRKQLIEMRKDQYVLKASFSKPIYLLNAAPSLNNINLEEKITLDADGNPYAEGNFTLLNPKHVSALLRNYSRIKEEAWDRFGDDSHYIMYDLEDLIDKTFKDDYPFYYDLIIYKIDGKTNSEIHALLSRDYENCHTEEYLSTLWRNKIPKMIAEQAKKDWLVWYYTYKEKGKWKRCSRCKEIKLAHPLFFTKNGTSKDGYYSLCKDCRKKGRIKMRARRQNK